MTRRHFETLAAAIREARANAHTHEQADTVWAMTRVIIQVCEQENPRFDRDRFLDACCPENNLT